MDEECGVEQKAFFKVDLNCIFVFLVLFKDGGYGVSLRFRLLVSGVNRGNEDIG